MKCVIMLVGAGAAGKTTTTQAFAMGDPEEFVDERIVPTRNGAQNRKVCWTLYDNCGVAGNHRSGTDANPTVSSTTEAMLECAKRRDIIIVDGYMSSPRWVTTANDIVAMYGEEGVIIAVRFDLSPEETVRRLANRREVTYESIVDNMLPKHEGLVKRVQGMVSNIIKLADVDVKLVSVTGDMDTQSIIDVIDDTLAEVYEDYGLDYFDENDVEFCDI